ncbi:MAG: hypothetical protein IKN30_09140 [Synergistaceae bacterium]|nr:hypothetical protein [Synergistaceae bacterium]
MMFVNFAMGLISSDTNIWIDFYIVNRIEHPFLLNHEYYISSAAFTDELVAPKQLGEILVNYGLMQTDIKDEELSLALEYQETYKKLSTYDSFALALAKNRDWILLTGDKPLRDAAECENVECHGVIWIYDELLSSQKISLADYKETMGLLIAAVKAGACRLPISELKRRC